MLLGLDKVVDVSVIINGHVPAVRITVVTQRQVPTVHSFILPVQLLDKVLDMPVVALRQVPGLMVQKNCGAPAVAVHLWSSTLPFVPQKQNLMVQTFQQTTEIPQLLFDGRCPRYAGVQSLRCCRGEDLCTPQLQLGLFLRPFIFGSHLFGVRPRRTPYSALLGSTVDT